jgi:hypothetical protein
MRDAITMDAQSQMPALRPSLYAGDGVMAGDFHSASAAPA